MASFRDDDNQDWAILITVQTLKDVKNSELDIDLMDIADGGYLEDIEDPIKLVDLLWLICEKQCKERDVTPEGFAGLLFGDTLDAATEAFLEGLTNFFPKRQREALILAREKVNETQDLGFKMVAEKIAGLDPKEIMAEAIALSESATKSPESSESIPVVTHSES